MQGEVIVTFRLTNCCLIHTFLWKIRELGGKPYQYLYILPETMEIEIKAAFEDQDKYEQYRLWGLDQLREPH